MSCQLTKRCNHVLCWVLFLFIAIPTIVIASPMGLVCHISDDKEEPPWNNVPLRLLVYLVLGGPFVISVLLTGVTAIIWYPVGEIMGETCKDTKLPFGWD